MLINHYKEYVMPVILPNAAPSTIVLLETIGQSASLRHASKSDLAQALGRMGASEGLKQALASGNHATLKQELGYTDDQGNEVNHNGHDGVWNPYADD